MAISILNTTYQSSTGTTNIISIPATTVDSTLIVLVSFVDPDGGTNGINYIQDNEVDPSKYILASGATGNISNQYNAIAYRTVCPAGLTTLSVFILNSASPFHVTVIEASGINKVSPLETSTVHTDTVTTSNPTATSITTAFTNALFVGTGISTQTNWSSLLNSWIKISGGASPTRFLQGYIIGSSTQTMVVNRSNNNSQTYIISEASFNPTATTFTLDLNDSLVTDDVLDNAADFVTSYADGVSLSEAFSASLTTLEHFKSLFDTLTLGVTITFVAGYIRLLQDSAELTDSITFVHDIFRTKSDTIRLQDWLSIKKIGSDWGE